jgi:hypothetical protein
VGVGVAMFALCLLGGLVVACQVGYLLGQRQRGGRPGDGGGAGDSGGRGEGDRDPQALQSQSATWQGAVLGLLGLLIGFTFAMAVSRFDKRKQHIVDEADIVGTAYLRTRALDEPGGMELRALLRRYVDARIAFFEAGMYGARIAEADRVTLAYQREIWDRVIAAARAAPQSLPVSLLEQATNDMIDITELRRAALADPVPPPVFLVLVLVAGIAMASIGWSCGVARRRDWFGMWIMPLLIGGVISLVYDIGRPRAGLVRLQDDSMLRLRQSL